MIVGLKQFFSAISFLLDNSRYLSLSLYIYIDIDNSLYSNESISLYTLVMS